MIVLVKLLNIAQSKKKKLMMQISWRNHWYKWLSDHLRVSKSALIVSTPLFHSTTKLRKALLVQACINISENLQLCWNTLHISVDYNRQSFCKQNIRIWWSENLVHDLVLHKKDPVFSLAHIYVPIYKGTEQKFITLSHTESCKRSANLGPPRSQFQE